MERKLTKFSGYVSFDEALKQGGLDWNVSLDGPLSSPRGIVLKNRYAVIAETDPPEGIGDVGTRYEPFSNRKQFGFIEEMVQKEELSIKQVLLGGTIPGSRVSIVTVLPKGVVINDIPQEEHEAQLVLSSSFDGSSALDVSLYIWRKICGNGLMGWGKGTSVSIRHTQNGLNSIVKLKQVIDESVRFVNTTFTEIAASLLKAPYTDEQMETLAKNVLGHKEEDTKEASTRKMNQVYQILTTYREAADLDHARNTKWAALQSITHFIDHQKSVQGPVNEREAKRFENSLFDGPIQNMRKKTLELLKV